MVCRPRAAIRFSRYLQEAWYETAALGIADIGAERCHGALALRKRLLIWKRAEALEGRTALRVVVDDRAGHLALEALRDEYRLLEEALEKQPLVRVHAPDFPDAGEATTGLSTACAQLLALGLPATVQLDVHEDGSLAGTFGLTLFFTGTHNSRMSLFCPDGAADKALRHLETLGVADGRWRQAVRGSFALPVPFAPKGGVLHVASVTCHPDCVKLKRANGRLAPARLYQVVRVAPLGTTTSTQ